MYFVASEVECEPVIFELAVLQFRGFAAAARELAGGLFGEEFGRHKKIPEERMALEALGHEISSLDGFAIAVADGRKLGVALGAVRR